MSEDEYHEHRESDDGYCARCKAFTRDGGVEPDAEDYECPECGNNTVVGAEQALFMGLILPGDED